MELAIDFARKNNFDGYLAVGGGSVMDTAKVANLFDIYRENELLDFVNAPTGKGKVKMMCYTCMLKSPYVLPMRMAAINVCKQRLDEH